MIILYFISIGILLVIGYYNNQKIVYDNTRYCRLLTKSISIILVNYKFLNFYDRKLITYYEKNKIHDIYVGLDLIIIKTNNSIDMLTWLFMAIVIGISFKLPDIEIYSKLKKRNESVIYDFARFTYDLSLYINSGLSVFQAFKKSTEQINDSYFYKNIKMVIYNSETGNMFEDELIKFSNRMMISEINTLVSLINQNIKYGGQIKNQMIKFSNEIWERRKNYARKKGEQASVNMVFPLTLGLIGVILILTTPAIMIERNTMKKLLNNYGMGTVEVVIIIAVLVGVALIFKEAITTFVKEVIDNVFSDQDIIKQLKIGG